MTPPHSKPTPPSPPPPGALPPIGSDGLGKLLYEISLLMGLSPAGAMALGRADNLRGPRDLLCRLQLDGDAEVTQVRPEVLLPIAARELAGPSVERLLVMQQALMLELGWSLGMSSEGQLQISPLGWISDAGAAVTALDLGQTLGVQTVRVLRGEDDAAGDTGAPPPDR
jgi:hypothetical protein